MEFFKGLWNLLPSSVSGLLVISVEYVKMQQKQYNHQVSKAWFCLPFQGVPCITDVSFNYEKLPVSSSFIIFSLRIDQLIFGASSVDVQAMKFCISWTTANLSFDEVVSFAGTLFQ